MAQLTVSIVEGWTGPLDFQLLNDAVSQNLTGLSVTGQALNRLKVPSDLTGDVVVSSATSGLVRFTPDTSDFLAAQGPYELRFAVADDTSGTNRVMFPNEEGINVVVRR